jgi:hypothetical protein
VRFLRLFLLSSVLTFAACSSQSSSPSLDTGSSSAASVPATVPVSPEGTTPATPPASTESASGVPLGQILERYETRAMGEGGDWASYTLRCWTPPVVRGNEYPPPVDRALVVGRGAVVECVPMTDPPADTSSLWLIVLDDVGTTTSWYEATDGSGAPPIAYDRPAGLLCREYMALPAFAEAMANVGAPPWADDEIAYQFALAYWFLEGQPARMDADGNGVPCELLFDPSVVTAVWAGDS